MKTTLKVIGIIDVIIGAIAFMGSDGEWSTFIGALIFLLHGILILVFLSQLK